jgi:hypothetical protein
MRTETEAWIRRAEPTVRARAWLHGGPEKPVTGTRCRELLAGESVESLPSI